MHDTDHRVQERRRVARALEPATHVREPKPIRARQVLVLETRKSSEQQDQPIERFDRIASRQRSRIQERIALPRQLTEHVPGVARDPIAHDRRRPVHSRETGQ
jgi:hypothetical protein